MTTRKARTDRPPTTEREVLAAVLAALRALGIEHQRQNTGGFRDPRGQYVSFGKKGNADITGTLRDGRRLEIECKRPGKRPTPDQLARLQALNRLGAVAFWTDRADKDFVEIVRSCNEEGFFTEVDDAANVWLCSPEEPRRH